MLLIVISLHPPYSPGSIIAEVQNFYAMASTVTKENVTSLIQEGIKNHTITNGTKFKGMSNASCQLFSSNTRVINSL